MKVLLFMLLAVLLMLSPMMWLRPSRGESLRGKLRHHVKRHGGELNFTKPPLALPDVPLVGYRLRYPGTAPGTDFTLVRDRVANEALSSATDQWRWRQPPLPALDASRLEALEAWLDSLPADALVVESHEHTLCVWWQEGMELARFQQDWATWLAMRDTLAGSGRKKAVPVNPAG
ncbi:preprotein translocase subunit YajC [Salinicola avicenniae]|uniref:preprotein translocase subunit YajC n=1 Tax=Salinicola avicenniae TaxID=2916836 RepID=UPI002073C28F|nr:MULTISPECIES: preprotein translocase subunit YajC [unclassified Salinicola]